MTQDSVFVTDKLLDLHQTFFVLHQPINSLLVNWKLTVLSFFFTVYFSRIYRFVKSASHFSSRFTCAKNMSNQISRIRMAVKKTSRQEQTFIQCSSLFQVYFVSSLLNKESMIRLIKPVVFSRCNYFTTQGYSVSNYLLILYQIIFSLLYL